MSKIADIQEILWTGYGVRATKIAEADDIQASNRHYRIWQDSRRFVLKQIHSPEALFGAEARSRIDVLSEAIAALGASGSQVEVLNPTNSGEATLWRDGVVWRLYDFIDGSPFDGSLDDVGAAARVLRSFHDAGDALPQAIATRLRALDSPMALNRTMRAAAEISSYLESEAQMHGAASDYGWISGRWSDVQRWLLELGAEDRATGADRDTLVHLDAHPDNFIFGTGPAKTPVLIDLDTMMFGSRGKCVAFAAMRFSQRIGQANWLNTLSQVLDEWLREEPSLTRDDLILWMRRIELEKVMRILFRVMETGEYGHFLRNIRTRHMRTLYDLEQALN